MENRPHKRILLINPPSEFKTPVLPLGLASIAAYLKEKNQESIISVIDAWAEGLSGDEFKKRIAEINADFIGISMVSPRYNEAKQTIIICREIFPQALIVAGGPHPSAVPEETLREIPELDVCIFGEGEITMHELAAGMPFEQINGIAFRENDRIKTNAPREFIKDLDSLPYPARDLFPLEKYRTHPPYGRENPYFSMINSRGCPFQCAYCSKDVFRQTFRANSPKRVCDELEMLISKYGVKEIHFYDDDFTMDMKRAEEICGEIIKRNIKIRWSCTTRVNLVDENLLAKMKQAGCWLISYGVESGNQKILDSINKGIKIEQIKSAFAITRKTGISTLAYLMLGLPGETSQTIKETVELAKKIKPTFVSWGILVVYPGSYFAKCVENGTYKGRLRNLNRQQDSISGTFFGKGNYVVFEDNLSFEELQQAIKKANRSFYLRPSYIFQTLKSIRTFSDLKYYISGGLEVIKSVFS